MAYTLSLQLLNRYTKYFNALDKAGVDFEIGLHQTYDNNTGQYTGSLKPLVKNIKGFDQLGQVWQAGCSPIKIEHITNFTGFREVYQKPTACIVTPELYKKSNPSVRFFAGEALGHSNLIQTYLITADPVERRIGDHTYRLVCTSGDYYHGELVYCAPETNAHYNYIDKGHIIVYSHSADKADAFMFVTDVLTLDMNYILAAFSVYPEAVMNIIPNKAYLPSKDVRLQLIKVEKGIPAKYQQAYQKVKGAVLAEFEKNTQSVMISKLTRKETPYVDLNGIRIGLKKAVYEAGGVSIEASNLSEVIFSSLNPNEEWDIFTLINIYTDWVESQFKLLPLKPEGNGFKEKKSFEFKINDIPIKVECFTDNTRRAVNGKMINVEELSKVMRRAGCYMVDKENKDYDNTKEYNNFVKEVSRMSLKVRDALANGMPVKTVYLESDLHNRGKEATNKHPKLRFTKKEKEGIFLVINKLDKKGQVTETTQRRIGKFVEFMKKVQEINKKAYFYGNHYGTNEWTRTHEGGWERKDGKPNECANSLLELLTTYVDGITEEEKTLLIGTINKELTEAEKRSEELLKEAIKAVGAEKTQKNGKSGYKIPGKLRNYFVEEDALRVYDYDKGGYICVVNRGEQGVGRDALVARLYALHNDNMIAKQVGTLAK